MPSAHRQPGVVTAAGTPSIEQYDCGGMKYKVISADDHIDLRFFPADVWTARAPVQTEGSRAAHRGCRWSAVLGLRWEALGPLGPVQGRGSAPMGPRAG